MKPMHVFSLKRAISLTGRLTNEKNDCVNVVFEEDNYKKNHLMDQLRNEIWLTCQQYFKTD